MSSKRRSKKSKRKDKGSSDMPTSVSSLRHSRPASSSLTSSTSTSSSSLRGFSRSTSLRSSGILEELVSDTQIQFEFRKLSKRDPVTKLKGLRALVPLFESKSADILLQVLSAWVPVYTKLALENDRRVRTAVYSCFIVLLENIPNKSLAPYIRALFPHWWIHCQDPVREVAQSARDAFNIAFKSKAKHPDVLHYCREEFLKTALQNLQHTPQTLCDMKVVTQDEAQEAYERVLSSTLMAIASFIDTSSTTSTPSGADAGAAVVATDTDAAVVAADTDTDTAAADTAAADVYARLFKKRTWKMTRSSIHLVRRSMYNLLTTIIRTIPQLVERYIEPISTTVCTALTDTTVSNHRAAWDFVVMFLKHFHARHDLLPQSFADEFEKRLFQNLSAAGYGSTAVMYPCLLPVMHYLPSTLISSSQDTLDFFHKFADALTRGAASLEANAQGHVKHDRRPDAKLAVSALCECIAFAASNRQHSAEIQHRVCEHILMPLLASVLIPHDDTTITVTDWSESDAKHADSHTATAAAATTGAHAWRQHLSDTCSHLDTVDIVPIAAHAALVASNRFGEEDSTREWFENQFASMLQRLCSVSFSSSVPADAASAASSLALFAAECQKQASELSSSKGATSAVHLCQVVSASLFDCTLQTLKEPQNGQDKLLLLSQVSSHTDLSHLVDSVPALLADRVLHMFPMAIDVSIAFLERVCTFTATCVASLSDSNDTTELTSFWDKIFPLLSVEQHPHTTSTVFAHLLSTLDDKALASIDTHVNDMLDTAARLIVLPDTSTSVVEDLFPCFEHAAAMHRKHSLIGLSCDVRTSLSRFVNDREHIALSHPTLPFAMRLCALMAVTCVPTPDAKSLTPNNEALPLCVELISTAFWLQYVTHVDLDLDPEDCVSDTTVVELNEASAESWTQCVEWLSQFEGAREVGLYQTVLGLAHDLSAYIFTDDDHKHDYSTMHIWSPAKWCSAVHTLLSAIQEIDRPALLQACISRHEQCMVRISDTTHAELRAQLEEYHSLVLAMCDRFDSCKLFTHSLAGTPCGVTLLSSILVTEQELQQWVPCSALRPQPQTLQLASGTILSSLCKLDDTHVSSLLNSTVMHLITRLSSSHLNASASQTIIHAIGTLYQHAAPALAGSQEQVGEWLSERLATVIPYYNHNTKSMKTMTLSHFTQSRSNVSLDSLDAKQLDAADIGLSVFDAVLNGIAEFAHTATDDEKRATINCDPFYNRHQQIVAFAIARVLQVAPLVVISTSAKPLANATQLRPFTQALRLTAICFAHFDRLPGFVKRMEDTGRDTISVLTDEHEQMWNCFRRCLSLYVRNQPMPRASLRAFYRARSSFALVMLQQFMVRVGSPAMYRSYLGAMYNFAADSFNAYSSTDDDKHDDDNHYRVSTLQSSQQLLSALMDNHKSLHVEVVPARANAIRAVMQFMQCNAVQERFSVPYEALYSSLGRCLLYYFDSTVDEKARTEFLQANHSLWLPLLPLLGHPLPQVAVGAYAVLQQAMLRHIEQTGAAITANANESDSKQLLNRVHESQAQADSYEDRVELKRKHAFAALCELLPQKLIEMIDAAPALPNAYVAATGTSSAIHVADTQARAIRSYLLAWLLVLDAFGHASFDAKRALSAHLRALDYLPSLCYELFEHMHMCAAPLMEAALTGTGLANDTATGASASHTATVVLNDAQFPMKVYDRTCVPTWLPEYVDASIITPRLQSIQALINDGEVELDNGQPSSVATSFYFGMLSSILYMRTLRELPTLVRAWWTACDGATTSVVTEISTQVFAGHLRLAEIERVRAMASASDTKYDPEEFEVFGNAILGEITAKYHKEEIVLGLVIRLPSAYPLLPPEVALADRRGIKEARARRWLLNATKLLNSQNGSIHDAVAVWKSNVDSHFDGVEDCPICYAIVHASTRSIPQMACRTCKHKFHSACLYKYFTTAGHSQCPMCRSVF
jgi:Ubiquitin conjugating domain-like/LTN1 family HEAT repeat region